MGDIMRTLLKCLVASVALFGVLTAYAAAPTEINLHIQNSSTSTITPSDVTGIYSGGPKLSAINASQTGNFYIIQKGASVVQFKYGWDASNYCQFNLSFSNATTYSNGTAVSTGNASCEVSGSGNQVQLTVDQASCDSYNGKSIVSQAIVSQSTYQLGFLWTLSVTARVEPNNPAAGKANSFTIKLPKVGNVDWKKAKNQQVNLPSDLPLACVCTLKGKGAPWYFSGGIWMVSGSGPLQDCRDTQ